MVMLSNTLDDIMVVMTLDGNKRAEADEDETSTKRMRPNSSGNKMLEQHCLRTMDGNNPEFLEHMTEYVRSSKATWTVKEKMINSGMWSDDKENKDVLSFDMVPDKQVFMLLEAVNDLEKSQRVLGGVFVYIDVTECRPRWLTEDHLFGKTKSPLEPKVVPLEDAGQESIRMMLNTKTVKPLWFHNDGQFWACWEIMMVAYVACDMMTENQVKVYRHLLQHIQEECKREGKVPMTMWLYDMNVRKFLANRAEYDETSLANHKLSVFRFEDKQLMKNTTSALPEYQAVFKKNQGPTWTPAPKKEEEKPKVSLTRAEELVRQQTKENMGFAGRMQAAKQQKIEAANRKGWGNGKWQKKAPGTGRKFYDENKVELTGAAKKEAWAAWNKNNKKEQKDKYDKEKWNKDSWKGGWHS